MTTSAPEVRVRRLLTMLGLIALITTLLHVGFTVLALTAGPMVGGTAEAFRLVRYFSPLLAALSFCGAALAFSGRTATRRPGLAGATFFVLALVCAVVVAACAAFLIRHVGVWALLWLMLNLPLVVAMFVCRRVFRSAQRSRLHAGSGWADRGGTDTT